jgi:hypothetical protein
VAQESDRIRVALLVDDGMPLLHRDAFVTYAAFFGTRSPAGAAAPRTAAAEAPPAQSAGVPVRGRCPAGPPPARSSTCHAQAREHVGQDVKLTDDLVRASPSERRARIRRTVSSLNSALKNRRCSFSFSVMYPRPQHQGYRSVHQTGSLPLGAESKIQRSRTMGRGLSTGEIAPVTPSHTFMTEVRNLSTI